MQCSPTLVEQALRADTGVRTAQAALQQARAQVDVQSAGLLPGVGASASAQRSRASNSTGNTFQAGFDASWEPDVFGRLRSGVSAIEADARAAEPSLADVQVSLSAEVAVNYIELRGLQQRLAIARSNLASQQETLQAHAVAPAGGADHLARYRAGPCSGRADGRARSLARSQPGAVALQPGRADGAGARCARRYPGRQRAGTATDHRGGPGDTGGNAAPAPRCGRCRAAHCRRPGACVAGRCSALPQLLPRRFAGPARPRWAPYRAAVP